MDLTGVVEFLQNSALSEWMRMSLKAVPVVNHSKFYDLAQFVTLTQGW